MMQLLPFPLKADHHLAAATQLAPVTADVWSERYALIAATAELLGLSDQEFANRLCLMRDAEGTALVVDLLDELRAMAVEFETIYRAIYLLRMRLRALLPTGQPQGALS